MAGHSHWHRVKHKKETADRKRGQIFSKLSRMISVAAREGGGDPATNSQLRLAIEKAKEFNFPKENIEKAIKRGTGELEGVAFERILYEAFGPGNVAIIIEGITDNKNRTLNEISQILVQHNGKLAEPGSVRWMFERKGVITVNVKCQMSNVKNKDELVLLTIDAGAEDIRWRNDFLEIYTKIEDLEKVKKKFQEKGIKIESATLDWVPKQEIEVEEKNKIACQKLFEALDELDSVQEIYSNLKE